MRCCIKILFYWFDIGSGHKPGVNHGLASIAACLRENGNTISIKHVDDSYSIDMIASEAGNNTYDVIGFSITTNQLKYFLEYSSVIRKSFNGLMIAGGVHATLDPESILKHGTVDGVCIGEGEHPLGILAQRLNSGVSHLDTPSFWWNDGDRIIKNNIHPIEESLSNLPLPDYSDFREEITSSSLGGYANILISRGCPYNCTYCCNHALKIAQNNSPNYFRMLSVDRSMSLLKGFLKEYPDTKGFIFEDDLLVTYSDWFREFGRKYKDEIGLPYTCNSRFEHIQKEEVAQILKDSGCVQVLFGMESGNEEYRKKVLKRGYSNKQIYKSIELLNKAGIPFFTYNILGFPLETKEQMESTVSINKEIRPHSGMAFFFYPYPGTDLYNICVENDLLNIEEMATVSGYREKPVINMTACPISSCIKLQHNLMLYFIVRRLSRVLKIDSKLFDKIIHSILMINSTLFINIFTKENFIKKLLRRIQYKSM